MLTLSNGHQCLYLTASGALGYDGLGWPWEKALIPLGLHDPWLFTSITKTLTWEPRIGNLRWHKPWDCVRRIPNGAVNAVGLTNPGFRWWMDTVAPRVNAGKLPPLIVSIDGTDHSFARSMARELDHIKVVGVEINFSCPNTPDGIRCSVDDVIRVIGAIRPGCRHPLIAKLSVVHDAELIVPALRGQVEAIDINSVPWDLVFPGQPSPLAKFGGGAVSGRTAQGLTWEYLRRLVSIGDMPVIGPSVWDYPDINSLLGMGACAISFGSIFLHDPTAPTRYVRQHKEDSRVGITCFRFNASRPGR